MGRLYAAAAAIPVVVYSSHLAARHVMKYTVGSAQVEAPSQGEETQVHSGPEAEPKHLLPWPGHAGRRQRIPADRPADPLSSALFSITSECTLSSATGWATASSSQIPRQRHTCSTPRMRWQVLGSAAESMAWLYLCFPGAG